MPIATVTTPMILKTVQSRKPYRELLINQQFKSR